MSNVVCFTHPEYQATDVPELTCRNCCRTFISRVREENSLLSKRRQLLESGDAPIAPTTLADLGRQSGRVLLRNNVASSSVYQSKVPTTCRV